MTILDEMRDAFGLALFSMGEDPNTRDAATIDAAADFLLQMKTVISGFDSATYLDRLADGDLDLRACVLHGRAAGEATEPEPRVRGPAAGRAPLDRLALHPDGLAEPRRGERRSSSFYLEPEVSASNAVASQVDTATRRRASSSRRRSWTTRRSSRRRTTLALLVFTEDLGDDNKLYEDAWARVKAD